MKVDILHEDDHLIAVDKPAGLLTLPDRFDSGRSNLLHYLSVRYEKIYITHRLDYETSGVIVVAKTPEAHRHLSQQFEHRQTDKRYYALVDGIPADDSGTIDIGIGNHPSQAGKMIPSPRGKEAVTDYEIREQLGSFALLDLRIHTGRTHQIRVHLQHIGHPLMVDPLYGRRTEFNLSEVKGKKYNLGRGRMERPLLSRTPLHAYRLELQHPQSGEQLTFEAEMHKDMRATINQLRKLS